jgi:U3 small nucleolar RNA-associated protein 20
MLKDCPSYNPPTAQIRFLLRWIAADLQSGGTAASAAAAVAGSSGGGAVGASSIGDRVSGYGLLRAVLGRRLLVPEVYDVMDIVQKQMMM